MTKDEKAHLKRHIRDRIDAVKSDIAAFKAGSAPVPPDDAIGRLTRMEAINSKSINEAALRKTQYALSKLERALRTIDSPDFGLCRECEEPIPFPRLMILPETDLCVECAEKMD